MRKLPLNGGNAMKAEECFVLPAPEPSWRQTGQVFAAMGSLSVLPFYGALLALVVAFHVQMSGGGVRGMSARLVPSAATKGCSAGGGCGTSGGCGSGGCGASSGKGCGCGSASSATEKSAPPKAKPATQIKVTPPTRATGIQSGQPSSFSPPRPVQTQPTVRIPTAPPNTGRPPNGAPAQTPLQLLTPPVPSRPPPAEAPGNPGPAAPAGK